MLGARIRQERASRLHQLATWLAAVAESIEAENNDAAEVHVLLDGIVRECEFIIAAGCQSSAAA